MLQYFVRDTIFRAFLHRHYTFTTYNGVAKYYVATRKCKSGVFVWITGSFLIWVCTKNGIAEVSLLEMVSMVYWAYCCYGIVPEMVSMVYWAYCCNGIWYQRWSQWFTGRIAVIVYGTRDGLNG